MNNPHRLTDCHEHHDLVRNFGGMRPRIVCLCGSTRFVDEFNRQRKLLTEAGEIVLSIEVVTAQARSEDPQHTDPVLKARLDELHKRKIDLADYVYIVSDETGYYGDSTRSEIKCARSLGNRFISWSRHCWRRREAAVYLLRRQDRHRRSDRGDAAPARALCRTIRQSVHLRAKMCELAPDVLG